MWDKMFFLFVFCPNWKAIHKKNNRQAEIQAVLRLITSYAPKHSCVFQDVLFVII